MKFRIFSLPINTKNWTLAMFSLAAERYDIAASIPLRLTHNVYSEIIPFVQGTHITRLEHLIPLIPDTMIKEFMINKYRLPKSLYKLSDPVYPSFITLDKDGNQITVQVLKENEREAVDS